ncbi:MAG: zinc-dependent alcohol dehydrogenase family protein [Thermoplasmata archaeon]|nr:zinc-dependent alcohol dehydrogenase family protein [Candidatus Sysuiplasma acidicola]MBX8646290.1 zinc-dependent alcohol dehydrogenase family protein [Candidatus Sysuiplasma acidicola]
MKAMALATDRPGEWLELTDMPAEEPGDGEVLIRVDVCGVCRTDLHIVEGDIGNVRPGLVPGHEAVGKIVRTGEGVTSLSTGDVVGVPWLHGTCGVCEFCVTGRENLCRRKTLTGYTVNGGYAEYMLALEAFTIPIASGVIPAQAAPLLCSGIIGYRAFKLVKPGPGGVLGIFGFGGSAHITLQIASALGYDVRVVSRNEQHLKLAMQLGATGAIELHGNDSSPLRGTLDAAIVFAPSGNVVRLALESVRAGGSVAVPAIHMDDIPLTDYESQLFHEKKLFSVEANTRADALEFMSLAGRTGIRSVVKEYRLEDANAALSELKAGKINGSAVLRII